MFLTRSIKDYLNQLSSDKPVPGGGGTSALAAALGIGLALMVARIASRKLKPAELKRLQKTIQILEHLRQNAETTIDLDPKIYREVIQSYARLKKAKNPNDAKAEVEEALENSFRLQADLALQIAMAKELLKALRAVAKGSIQNDLIVSAALLDGAFKGAAATARINLVYMQSGKTKRHFEQALAKVEQKYQKIKFA